MLVSCLAPKNRKKKFCCYSRNVVTGAHYHFVSRWASSTSYFVAALVMMIFVRREVFPRLTVI